MPRCATWPDECPIQLPIASCTGHSSPLTAGAARPERLDLAMIRTCSRTVISSGDRGAQRPLRRVQVHASGWRRGGGSIAHLAWIEGVDRAFGILPSPTVFLSEP